MFFKEQENTKLFLLGERVGAQAVNLLEEIIPVSIVGADHAAPELPAEALIPAYTLALKGLQHLPVQLNFLPAHLRKQPSRAGQRVFLALAASALILVLLWSGGAIVKKHQTIQYLETELERLKGRAAEFRAEEAKLDQKRQRIQYLNNARQQRVSFVAVIAELTRQIPDSAWIKDMDFSKNKIQIRGFADSASELIPGLESSPMFKNVVFLSTIRKRPNGGELFRIGLELE